MVRRGAAALDRESGGVYGGRSGGERAGAGVCGERDGGAGAGRGGRGDWGGGGALLDRLCLRWCKGRRRIGRAIRCDPASVYGASKLAGEQELARSRRGAPDLPDELGVWGDGEELSADDSEGGAGARPAAGGGGSARRADVEPGSGADDGACDRASASGVRRVGDAGRIAGLLDAVAQVGGVYHAAGAGETTWYGFAAEAVRQQAEREPEVRLAEIDPIATAEYPTPARRPANSRLDCGKLEERLAGA